MKKRLLCLAMALILAFSLMPVTALAAEAPVEVTVAGTEQYTYAAEVVTLSNEQRSENGANPLSRNATLTELAMQRAAEVALYFSHTRPDGSDCFTVVDGEFSGYTTLGENIAIGQGDPVEVMEAWMNSEGHRANILETGFTQIGVGCFVADGVCCWVQLFSNSSTDTATTSTTGSVVTTRDVSILPSNLDLSPTGTMELELQPGESTTLTITSTNPEFPYMAAALIPQVEDITDSQGNTLATVTSDASGLITVTAQATGSGTAEIPVYSGQSNPLVLRMKGGDDGEDEELYFISWQSPNDYLGNVTLSASHAPAGETVYIYVTPDEGYTVDQVTLYGTASDRFDFLTPDSTGETWVYSFVMPAENVSIEVSFGVPSTDTAYPIQVYSSEGGDAYASVSEAKTGDSFILYVYPDAGYTISEILYYAADGSDLRYEWLSDTSISIIMPAGELNFEVYFTLSENPFVDVSESAYYYEPVLWAVTNGITSGVSANRFGPNNSCTRAQVVTFLWRAAGSPDPVNWDNPFKDVSEDAYYYKAVLWAVEYGITSGVSADRFGPNNVCTRAQVVTFLWRAVGSPDPTSNYNPFRDVSENAYYYNAVLWAVEYGITSGVSDTRFGSGNTCTRAHVVTFLYKTFHG